MGQAGAHGGEQLDKGPRLQHSRVRVDGNENDQSATRETKMTNQLLWVDAGQSRAVVEAGSIGSLMLRAAFAVPTVLHVACANNNITLLFFHFPGRAVSTL